MNGVEKAESQKKRDATYVISFSSLGGKEGDIP